MPRRRRSKLAPIQLERKTVTTVIGFGAIALSLLLLLSFFTSAGALMSLKDTFYNLFGIAIVFVPFLIIAASLPLFSIKSKFTRINVLFGAVAALLSFVAMISPLSQTASGILGSTLWQVVKSTLTPIGGFFVLFFTFWVAVFVTLNTSLDQAASAIVSIYKKIVNALKTARIKIFGPPKPKFVTKTLSHDQGKPQIKEIEGKSALDLSQSVILNTPAASQVWEYPPLSLLSDAKGGQANRGNVKQNAQIIEKTLESFGITATVAEVNPGPTVTQYALKIPSGTKLSKILTLQNDLALALATKTGNVRIEAPIPGKSLVGIEIPNISSEVVSLKNILLNQNMQSNKSKLAVGLGLDVAVDLVITDIAKMPHVLISGTTGSGKSVLINTIIATILFRASPQEVKFILVDPKRVELTDYNDIPHLLTPVIVESEKILSAMKWAIAEMNRRYKLLHDAQVRNIAAYNELSGFQALPYIVIVIDELQNLMEFAPREVEDTIVHLAAMARATGIHLVIATQRPSVDVITGIIKANIPCRIAFNVSSMIDSRVIIDQPGAEKLIGKGDMLYVPPDASKPMRIQGVFVSDTEIRNLIGFLKRSGIAPEYTEEVIHMPIGKTRGGQGLEGEKDELFEEAVRTVCQYDRASASLLQRRLRIGYARAARLLDTLEEAGVVGQGEGAKPRDVLVKNPDDYFATHAASQTEAS
ncbi:hypothetical protein A3A60_01825 [Candidatus Curtissbacteria bacterium RIFCSPLOWO2_01_FULL_42_26]|uniref:FtsK domain-containing protein n=1 Tax=Candidatus Curtissbacteria bacterium RIFCSPLOWO2_01_FULL_42_26 TaxID=1797729 RepID=A0A1F5I1K2_9BACT|nr:MAG: hypothetical protein A3A60_01825 [Candidatus Curtissbacteria bacterium RIFCSPLOWO2_01_FULL_42_26]